MIEEELNREFHAEYDLARAEQEDTAPVLVVLVDSLIVCRGASRTEHVFTPSAVHTLKSIAHGPIGVFAVVGRTRNGDLDARTLRGLDAIHGAATRICDSLSGLAEDERVCGEEVLTATTSFIDTLRAAPAAEVEERLLRFASGVGPALLRLTSLATALQMQALHAAVETALTGLEARERALLHVVVAGDHQARARSLGMQYFAQRLQEPPHAEHRLIYGEGVETVEEALKLAATQRIDRAIATAFFGDAKRLQRDILGDAAATYLRANTFPPI